MVENIHYNKKQIQQKWVFLQKICQKLSTLKQWTVFELLIAWFFYGVVVERQLFEPCENEQQCNGTVNAGKCREVANHSFCFCNDGLVEYQGRCVEGSFVFVSTINVSYISVLYLKYFQIILMTLIYFTH